ncbi:uncharacterized protein LOC144865869 [Branchiostoma floridae x Branchiostoma japonicum]
MAEREQQEKALRDAAEHGDTDRVEQLLEEGVNPDAHANNLWKRTPLHLAAQKGHHETVSALLAAGADVNAQGDWKKTPLHRAAGNGHHETVSALLAAGAHVNVQDDEQRTPLHLAVENGHHETLSALLAAGADVNIKDRHKKTPLHLAAEKGHHETVSALLAAGADVNVQDRVKKTPLHMAAEKGHHETVSALLTAGADVNAQGRLQKTPLHLAADKGHHETVSALLTAGADVNVQDMAQMTPLHLAAEKGHHETVSALLAAGADVNVQDMAQRTPLYLAAENGHHETVAALLTAGAEVDVRDWQHKTPLHWAAYRGHHETVSALLAAGADVNVQDKWQWTPLHPAAEKGHHETATALLTADADVNKRDSLLKTPLHLAAENGHHETISALLTAGADVNVQGEWQITPLHLAAERGHHETVSALLAADAHVNVWDIQKRTPLHLAAENGHHETVSALLTAGADVNLQDWQHMTSLHWAAIRGHHETVSALLAAGAVVNVRNCQRRTPLHLAAEDGHHETVSVLLTADADVNEQDNEHMTALHWAAIRGHNETVSALLAAGADVNTRDGQHMASLHWAAIRDHHETLSALLTAGADVNVRIGQQGTPLHLAAENGHHETVSALLAAGADMNVKDMWHMTALHWAAIRGHHETVSALLTDGADMNIGDGMQMAPLHLAAEYGHHGTVLVLLAPGADVNVQDALLRTPLHLAAENGHHETVAALLTAGANANVQDSMQVTPLHLAVEKGQPETTAALLTAGANANVRDSMGSTPLHYATERRHSKCVEVLLQHKAHKEKALCDAAENGDTDRVKQLMEDGVNPDSSSGQWLRTPLHLAAENGHHETVAALLTAGANANVQDSMQVTPLHLAVEKGQPETTAALLAAGANANVRDSMGSTPLHYATERRHSKCVEVLLQHKAHKEKALCDAAENGDTDRVKQLMEDGVNPDSSSGQWQRTPLHLAAENGHHETMSALLTAGADFNVQDSQQWTPLHDAAENGHHRTVSALLGNGADVNTRGGGQRTPLHLAAENDHHETVSALLAAPAVVVDARSSGTERTPLHEAAGNGHHKIVAALLKAGADVNSKDNDQSSVLHEAAENGHLETVSALLTTGADVNAQDSEQRTPLHRAALNGHNETVSALLAAGADVNVQDISQNTPLHLAAQNGHPETVSELLAAGADVNAMDNEGKTPLQYATEDGHSKCTEVLLQHGADEDSQKEGASGQKEVFDPVLVHFYEDKGMTLADSKDPLVREAAKQAGKTTEEVLNFIINYSQPKLTERPSADDTGKSESKESSSIGFDQMLDTILSRLEEADVRLLMRVWSARTGKQESTGAGAELPADLIKDMMKSEYITTGDLRMLEKDMMAAGISFPAIVRDIPGVPEEMKYTRTTEAAIGPTGGELEIPGFVKLVVPPGVLQQDTMITISTVDVAAILRDPKSVNWLSGYPWSLGEDACPRDLLNQVLFSPAVDVNLHGAQLNGPVEVQTWRPPGSEGMECILLKHHDGEGWTDITASTVHQICSDKISTYLQTFSPLTILWAPVDALITIGKVVVAALSSRTLNCRFAGYIKPHTDGVEFHVVCRDRSVKTDNYKPDFTLCGSNKAMFDLYHGNRVDVTVNILQGQERSRQMKLHAQQCCEDKGQSVQMLLDRPNGKPVKGDVTISNIQVRPPETVCEFCFWEEGDTWQIGQCKRGSTAEESGSQSTPTDQVESARHNLAATRIADNSKRVGDVLTTETEQPQAGPEAGDVRTGSIARGPGSKPVVLLISEEYINSHGDVSTIHRQMAGLLASKGAEVYSTVLGATQQDEDDAAADGVRLILPAMFEGDERNASLHWLTWDHQTRYPNLPTDVDFILGHVNITSRAARQIKEQRLPGAKLVQVTHVMPEDTSHYQGDERATSIGEEIISILDELQHADVVFSIGPYMCDYYKSQTREMKPLHEYLPKPSDIFSELQVNYVNSKAKVVLSIGRIKGMERLKGYDLVAKSMFSVMEQLPNAKWRAFGVSPEDFPESKKAIQAHVERGKIHFTPLKHTTEKELSEEMKKAHVVLMPSRAEPFGLVGLEAIAAGVPVLVSNKSGLAYFLDKHSDLDRPIVEIEDDDDEAAKVLAKRIIRVLKDGSKEFEAAKKMKEHLLSSKPWEASHKKFLETFGL